MLNRRTEVLLSVGRLGLYGFFTPKCECIHGRAPVIQLITDGIEGDSGWKWSCDTKVMHVGGKEELPAFQMWRAEVVVQRYQEVFHFFLKTPVCMWTPWQSNVAHR